MGLGFQDIFTIYELSKGTGKRNNALPVLVVALHVTAHQPGPAMHGKTRGHSHGTNVDHFTSGNHERRKTCAQYIKRTHQRETTVRIKWPRMHHG